MEAHTKVLEQETAVEIVQKTANEILQKDSNEMVQKTEDEMDVIKTAYIRQQTNALRCELSFTFDYQTNDETVPLEICAVRGIGDTLGSLKTHIINKINYTLHKLNKESVNLTLEFWMEKTNNRERVEKDEDIKLANLYFVKGSEERDHYFSIEDQKFRVYINFPVVKSVSLPERIFVGIGIKPMNLKTIQTDNRTSKYEWSISEDKVNWKQVGTGYHFMPTSKCLGKFVKLCIRPHSDGKYGPYFNVYSIDKVQEGPRVPGALFEKRHEFTKEKLNDYGIRIVSYNILSDLYARKNSQYAYCPPEFLSIDYRKTLILKELTGYNADLIALQEVDRHVYYSFLRGEMERRGYKSVFHLKGNQLPEGLATFYNCNRFALRKRHMVVLKEVITEPNFQDTLKLLKGNPDAYELFMKQVTSLQYSVFKLKDSKDVLILLANTHLFYHSEAAHIRLIQLQIITRFLKSVMTTFGPKPKLIFCGDFNSSPTSSSYEFLTKGKLELGNEDCNKFFHIHSFKTHNLNLASACGTPQFTNYVRDFQGCLDYIFYQKDKNGFRVEAVAPFPDEEELKENVALPSKVFPSDHVALIADLEVLRGGDEKKTKKY